MLRETGFFVDVYSAKSTLIGTVDLFYTEASREVGTRWTYVNACDRARMQCSGESSVTAVLVQAWNSL